MFYQKVFILIALVVFITTEGEGQKAATQQDALLSSPNVAPAAADNQLNPVNSNHAGPSEGRKVKRFAVNDEYLQPGATDAERETRFWNLIPQGWKLLQNALGKIKGK